jgi:Protein of unknown function (DUF4031)
MASRVYPVGYSSYQSAEYVEQLMSNPSMLLIDIRSKPYSWRSEWQSDALKAKYGKRYRLAGAYLGNVNHQLPNGWPIKIADPETGIGGLVRYLNEGYDLILLCQCGSYDDCHRKVVVDLLQKVMLDVVVVQPDVILQVESTDILKCISIQQPFGWLITNPEVLVECGLPIKDIENREWSTSYRGRLLIHTGRDVDEDLFTRGKLDRSYWVHKFGEAGARLHAQMPQHRNDYPLGAIVGEAILQEVVTASKNVWFRGRYGFVLREARAFSTPIPYPGALKIFDVPSSVIKPDERMLSGQQDATIYVDDIVTYENCQLPYKRWCHMATDGDIEVLHAMAARIGLKREWFQDKPKHPHYDLTPSKRAEAINLGAVPVSSFELLEKCWPRLRGERN